MKISPIQALLVLGIVLAAAAHLALAPDPQQRNFVYAPEMSIARGYEAQDPNPNFADGKTLQRPPEGTIAQGFPPLAVGEVLLDVAEEDWTKLSPEQQQAWDRLRPPWGGLELDAAAQGALLRRGAIVFTTWCVPCHGPTGAGDGLSVKRGVPPPPAYTTEDIKVLSDGHMFRSITRGKGNMASYASQVSREDRWKAIRYIRTLQGAP